MGEVKKAKVRASVFLLRKIGQKWDNFKKKGEKLPDYWKAISWPLRFEAYCYLGYKDKRRIQDFALVIRELWNEWIHLYKLDLIGRKKIFWPTEYEYIYNVDPDGNADKGPGNEIENHIAMFRVKEILEIGGYDFYFNEAKKILKEMLLDNYPYSWYKDYRIIWQIVRSPMLRSELADYIKIVFLKIKDEQQIKEIINNEEGAAWSIYYSAMVSFFLSFSNLGTDSFDIAKIIASKLIDSQEKNGSFDNNGLITCLCASSIHTTKSDTSRSVSKKAFEYILSIQNKDGSWDFIPGEDETLPILSTVVALETIDFITDDKPLPIWADPSRQEIIFQEKKPTRIQIDKPLPIPQEINWGDVSIYFISPDSAEVRAGKPLGVKNFIEMGFKDRRTGNPDRSWGALRVFSRFNGEISWKDKDVNIKDKEGLKCRIKDIRKRLKYLFGIKKDPFFPYDRKEKAYRTKFKISIREEVQD